jgi:hypothetical protein
MKMNLKKHSVISCLVLMAMFMGGLLLTWSLVSTQAGADLPGRNTPTPTGPPAGDQDNGPPAGAHIELHVPSAPAGAWTVVQWQDSAGGWHDVEGWRGTLDASGYRRWWVDAKDFGTGPFRWVVSQGPDGPVLGISQPFNLPSEAGQVLPVTASLGTP